MELLWRAEGGGGGEEQEGGKTLHLPLTPAVDVQVFHPSSSTSRAPARQISCRRGRGHVRTLAALSQ